MLSREEIIVLLSEYIEFEDKNGEGSNLAAKCPFHKGGRESKPSFYVCVKASGDSSKVGASFCHTCGQGWSLTGLLRKLRIPGKVIDTVREIVSEDGGEAKKKEAKFEWDVLPEISLALYEDHMPVALSKAGFKKDTLLEYEVGFDKPRGRIIFPIRNHHGELVGMSGRTVLDEHPRYKIYQKELHDIRSGYAFKKGTVLWGLDKFYQLRMNTEQETPVVVCEGFKAAMWVWQETGLDTVATMGTHLSEAVSYTHLTLPTKA